MVDNNEYYIYYMYRIDTGEGYIGQNKQLDAVNRILEHHADFLKNPNAKDGGVSFFRDLNSDYSLMRYKFFSQKSNYGIPMKVYTEFFKVWKLDGIDDVNNLSEGQKVDLAEMFHIIAAGLQGRQWRKYNIRPGGFDSSKVLTYTFNTNDLSKIQGLKNVLPSIRTNFEVTNFSVDLRKNPDDWKKIVYPIGQVVTTAILDDKAAEILSNDVWSSIINNTALQKKLVDFFKNKIPELFVKQSIQNPGKLVNIGTKNLNTANLSTVITKISTFEAKQKGKSKKDVVNEFTQGLVNIFKEAVNENSIVKILEQRVKSIFRARGFKFTFNITDKVVKPFVDKLTDRIESISLEMWGKIFSSYNQKKKTFNTSVFAKYANQSLGSIELKFSHFDVDFDWDTKTELPEWAKELNKTQLTNSWSFIGDNSDLKIEICKQVCEKIFPIIESNTKSPIGGQQNTLQYKLYEALKTNRSLSGYSWDFANQIIEVWHEYKYGHDAWITKEQAGLIRNGATEVEKKLFARRDVVEKEKDNPSMLRWYRGKFYESSGISQGDLEKAAKVLASRWIW